MKTTTAFAPTLIIPNGVTDIGFYKTALGAVEFRRFNNDDGSVHIAEFSLDDAVFRVHEQTERWSISPASNGGTTVTVNLFLDDPDAVFVKAIVAGASEISPMQDYDYGYRQGEVKDPFGHHWMFEKII